MLLIAMEESRQKSYAEVANVLYGTRAGITVDVTIALYNFGVLVSYVTWLQPYFNAFLLGCMQRVLIHSLLIGGSRCVLLLRLLQDRPAQSSFDALFASKDSLLR